MNVCYKYMSTSNFQLSHVGEIKAWRVLILNKSLQQYFSAGCLGNVQIFTSRSGYFPRINSFKRDFFSQRANLLQFPKNLSWPGADFTDTRKLVNRTQRFIVFAIYTPSSLYWIVENEGCTHICLQNETPKAVTFGLLRLGKVWLV